MRQLLSGLLIMGLSCTTAVAGHTGCIQDNLIDYTDIPNDSTIMFHMRDGSIYRNDLPQTCVGLKNASGGFTYEPTDPSMNLLCDDLGMFHVNETSLRHISGGQVCNFGSFTQIAGPHGLPIKK